MPDLPSDAVLEIEDVKPSGKIEVQIPEDVTYDENARWRVVGGSDAEEGQFPYIVSLRRVSTGAHFCGGTIVSNAYVLSATHCTEG